MRGTAGTAAYHYPLFVRIVCNGYVAGTRRNEAVDWPFAVTRSTDRIGDLEPMMAFPTSVLLLCALIAPGGGPQ
jgi:hypothetical protein